MVAFELTMHISDRRAGKWNNPYKGAKVGPCLGSLKSSKEVTTVQCDQGRVVMREW